MFWSLCILFESFGDSTSRHVVLELIWGISPGCSCPMYMTERLGENSLKETAGMQSLFS